MDTVWSILGAWGHAVLALLAQPYYYIAILLTVLMTRRHVALERKLYHARLHATARESLRSVLWGLAAGLAVSLPMAFIGAYIRPGTMILLWGLSLVFALFGLRFLCLAYAVGALGILQALLPLLPDESQAGAAAPLIRALGGAHMPSLFLVVGFLHLAEAWLVRSHGGSAIPMFYEGKRGRVIGGYQLQGLWPLPLFLWMPAHAAGTLWSWSPFAGGDLWANGWQLAALPVVLGFGDRTVSGLPRAKLRSDAGLLAGYAAVMLASGILSEAVPGMTIAAGILAIGLHEGIVAYGKFRESQKPPFFVHDARGLKILAVLPGSPAREMGIEAGEILRKVNDVRIRRKEDLHQALRLNPAFCRLEVLNLEGHSKFVKRAIYQGEHHQLGIVLAPDEDAAYAVRPGEPHLIAYFRSRLAGLLSVRAEPGRASVPEPLAPEGNDAPGM